MLTRFRMLAIGLLAAVALGMPQARAQSAGLRISMAADPATVEPVTASELNAFIIYAHMYETLLDAASDGSLAPALAERWEIFPERNAIRYHLRRGVRFHTGNPLTADAVKGTYEILLAPKTRAGIMGLWAGAIAGAADYKAGKTTGLSGVKVIDDYTVEVTLQRPNSVFIAYPIQIVDPAPYRSGDPGWLLKGSAGTGPYRFGDWQRGSEVRLVANADYWGGKPKIDEIRYLIVPDQNTALSMYRTGELNIMPLATSMYRQVLGDGVLKREVSSARATSVNFLSMSADRYEPFRDPRVRGAVCLSLDQTELKDGLYHGLAEIMNGPVPPAVPGSDPALPPVRIDPPRARALLAEAGYPGGKGLPKLTLTMTETNKLLSLYVASKLDEVLGMKVDLEMLERGTLLRSMNARQLMFYNWGWSLNYLDAMNYLGELWYGPSPYNKSWQNPEFDALIGKARGVYDDPPRFALYAEAQQLMMADWGMCPLPSEQRSALIKPEVRGVAYSPRGLMIFKDATLVD